MYLVFFTGLWYFSVPRWKELELEDKQYEIEKELSDLHSVTGKCPCTVFMHIHCHKCLNSFFILFNPLYSCMLHAQHLAVSLKIT